MTINPLIAPPGERQPGLCWAREIVPEWVGAFALQLADQFGPDAHYNLRTSPGVSYVPRESLEAITPDAVTTEEDKLAWSQGGLEIISGSRSLGLASIAKPTSAKLDHIRVEMKRDGMVQLRARLYDPSSGDYQCGFQMEGEKYGLKKALKLPASLPRTNRPRHWAHMGYVSGIRTDYLGLVSRDLTEALPRDIGLLPVQPIFVD